METKSLVARLNSHESLAAASAEEKKYGQGIYANFGEESELYRNGNFKKVIDSLVSQAMESGDQKYQDIASDITSKISQQRPGVSLEIKVYDPKLDDYLRNVNDERSMIMSLDDKVKDYIVEKEIESDGETHKVDYLDIVVVLNSIVGSE